MPSGEPWPRVSIITPSFNQVEFIEETIRSVILQGYPDLEYMLIDGGSTDGSVDIIRKYQPWLADWVSGPDRGQTYAINEGWRRATGGTLAYLNSDDCYLPGAITAAAAVFHAQPRIGMVYGTALVVDERGEKLRVWEGRPFDLKIMLTEGSIVPQPATFFSRNALEEAGYLDEKWHMIMDYELCTRVGLQFPSVCLPAALARFRDHARSKTNTRFEVTAAELLHWLETFSPNQVAPRELRTIKRATISRIHYELALTFLAQGRQHASNALSQLLRSILHHPLLAVKRPLATVYIIKEVLLGYFTTTRVRLSPQNSERHVLR
jgi:glycosyltransferase involved in cell wall biosynthesis